MVLKGGGANPANLALNSKHVTEAVDIVVGELQSRFNRLLSGSEDQASNVVKCFRVFNHDAWPKSQTQLLDDSIEELDVLWKHFGDIRKKTYVWLLFYTTSCTWLQSCCCFQSPQPNVREGSPRRTQLKILSGAVFMSPPQKISFGSARRDVHWKHSTQQIPLAFLI
ncbi:hypothetical protein SKAU_G00302830 [Synaphobranchus kaupii]|uniref:Uncharacterized protein n=1 Tax=Synaphobranchus kaupii TaxID=118154 RepID=A0A9Q1ILB9_SYNKA|nr:hypothetical protein SKAU_G00302830 [Synaphobranchus kaupii]